ncbi:MAG: translation elongation factor-like protein [Candidatus Aenigmatarchaeota archaeon]
MKKLIGKVTHYYSNIEVAVVELEDELKEGDQIFIEGVTTNIQQTVDSIQLEHEKIKEAHAGDSVGLKVAGRVRLGDKCYLVE